ncbi:MAG: helix-turn-helix domain-containing protein [Planctomycetota bacterium]|jgi:AraC-like DNA-binding protein
MKKRDTLSRFIPRRDWIAVSTERRERVWPLALERHEGYELVLIDSGRCELQIEEKSYPMGPGDVAFIAEGEHHRANVPGQCTVTYVDFRPGLLFSHRGMLDLFLRPFLNGLRGGPHCWPGQAALMAQARRLIEMVRGDRADVLSLTGQLLGLMRTFAPLKCRRPRRSVADRLRIQPALDLIFSAYAEKLSVDRMAEACAMSRATLKRAFRSATGRSPKSFLIEHRLQQAARLLLTTDMKTANIAFSVGYANLSNFNRQFLRRFGATPSGHRRSG